MRLVDGGLPYRGTHRRLRTIRLRGNWSWVVFVLLGFVVTLVTVQLVLWIRGG